MKRLITVCTFLFLTVVEVQANESGVAKVIILKGSVSAIYKDGKEVRVQLDQWLPEGSKVTTQDKSFVKLLFIDKSQMNLGPKSEMEIASFPKNEAGIISLVKGQLRSKVTKDYMQMDDKSKSKLYIKTKSAAMGIRGTDFQVNFNEANQNTSLITFEGAVAMAGIEKEFRGREFSQDSLERVVSSEKAVLVKEGQFSAVTQISERALVPTLLAPQQLETLKVNETGVVEKPDEGAKNDSKEGKPTESNEQAKNFKSPIPPGADSTLFSSNAKGLDTQVEKTAESKASVEKIAKEIEKTVPKADGPAEGFYNQQTGAIKFPAGSVVDLATVNVIPPPQNAQFDANTKTFILPPNFGKIDSTTGGYKAPEGTKLTDEGKFVVVKPATDTKVATSGTQPGRAPASTVQPIALPNLSIVPGFIAPGSTTLAGTGLLPPPPTGTVILDPTKIDTLATDKIQSITNTINQTTETGVNNPNSRVRFIFNAQ